MKCSEVIAATSGINWRSREFAKITENIPIASKKFAKGPASITNALCHLGLLSKVFSFCFAVMFCSNSEFSSSSTDFSV